MQDLAHRIGHHENHGPVGAIAILDKRLRVGTVGKDRLQKSKRPAGVQGVLPALLFAPIIRKNSGNAGSKSRHPSKSLGHSTKIGMIVVKTIQLPIYLKPKTFDSN